MLSAANGIDPSIARSHLRPFARSRLLDSVSAALRQVWYLRNNRKVDTDLRQDGITMPPSWIAEDDDPGVSSVDWASACFRSEFGESARGLGTSITP
jgi:hypothetical protein